MAGVTFPVSDVVTGSERSPIADPREWLELIFHHPVEDFGLSDPALVRCGDTHALVNAVHTAFYSHYPLLITPDDIWFCIAQGFARHVNLNAEKLRHRFVGHQGKSKLIVTRPEGSIVHLQSRRYRGKRTNSARPFRPGGDSVCV